MTYKGLAHRAAFMALVIPAAKPRMTMEQLLSIYQALTPAEQIAFGRAIGVERVWLPRQRYAAAATA